MSKKTKKELEIDYVWKLRENLIGLAKSGYDSGFYDGYGAAAKTIISFFQSANEETFIDADQILEFLLAEYRNAEKQYKNFPEFMQNNVVFFSGNSTVH